MSARTLAAATLLLAVTGANDHDEARAAWRYRRALTVSAPQGSELASLPLPPELLARAQPDLRDLRLVGPDGQDVPYVIDRQAPREAWQHWTGRLVDSSQERRRRTVVTVDLDETRVFGLVQAEIPDRDFAKLARLEASDDLQSWRLLRAEAGLFERAWGGGRVRHTTIALERMERARYLRLTTDDTRTEPVPITQLVVSAAWAGPEARWQQPASVRRVDSNDGVSRYRIETDALPPFESLELQAADAAFSRSVRLRELPRPGERRAERLLGEGTLYRVPMPELPQLHGESRELAVQAASGGLLQLEIEDHDSPPLRDVRAVVSGPGVRLIFPLPDGPLQLYYDNDSTRAPLYDLAGLQWRLQAARLSSPVQLGPESANPRFARPAPLQGTPLAGAPLEVARWRYARAFDVADGEDLYSFTLAAADLGRARRDLADLRIVDEQERQVPYILEPAAAEERVTLTLTRDDGPAPRGADTRASRYVLGVPPPSSGRAYGLPLTSVRLEVEQPFFSRSVRLWGELGEGRRRERETLLATVTLQRAPGATAPVELALDAVPRRSLRLEIDEGDDQPLVLTSALGVLRVPRLTFKARPGAYRLLLGNDEAATPRYDLKALTREILALSAVPLELQPAGDNRAFRRRAGDYFKNAPPTLLLWGTLLAAVLGLVFMTARLLRQAAAKDPDSAA